MIGALELEHWRRESRRITSQFGISLLAVQILLGIVEVLIEILIEVKKR